MKYYLRNRRAYLGGAIEFADPDDNWRDEVKMKLFTDFGLKIFDPYEDPKQSSRDEITKCKETGKWDRLVEIMHKFARLDLSIVDRADLIIQHLPYKVPTTGTVHEIINSNDRKKPTLLVCPQGKGKIPDWYWAFIKPEYMFGSWQDLYAYLGEVDEGKHKDDDRWFFVYHYNDLAWIR